MIAANLCCLDHFMLSSLLTFISQLRDNSVQCHCRRLVIVEGALDWSTKIAIQFSQHYPSTLWAGETAPSLLSSCRFKNAKQWLGQETDCLIINAHDGIDANVLGALSGTIRGGGVLLLLLPSAWSAPELCSRFSQHIANVSTLAEVIRLREDQPLPPLVLQSVNEQCVESFVSTAPRLCLTAQQDQAVDAILKVSTGHRKRPLVLSADRGRGKSSALGIAAAELMSSRKIKIAVTAPSFACAATIFAHAAQRIEDADCSHPHRIITYKGSELVFVAADMIGQTAREYDLILVDEAAAIAADTLSQLLDVHNRLVFATTIHGYEGTGRGFEIKFKQALNLKMPQWRGLHLDQPIRWASNDPLEAWVFKALLLDAEHSMLASLPNSKISYCLIDKAELMHSSNLLSQIVGLLIHAHYQTSPNDIQQLLNDDSQQLIVARAGNDVVGCCLVIKEGGFDDSLASDIVQGKRRPKGHLLAQSVAAHLGFKTAAMQSCYRILRIAVLPTLQHQGIGQQLIHTAEQVANEQSIDYIGTSFGATPELVSFWSRCQFEAIRLGITKDSASGHHSLLMVKALNNACHQLWLDDAKMLFAATFEAQRVEQFSDISPLLFIFLYRHVSVKPINYLLSSSLVKTQLAGFANGSFGYDTVVASFEMKLSEFILNNTAYCSDDLLLCTAKVLQKQSWADVVTRFNLIGRKQAEAELRSFVGKHLLLDSINTAS